MVTWAWHHRPLWTPKCTVAPEQWLDEMRQDRHWGDHVSLFCMAQLLHRPMVVFKDLPGVPPLLLAPLDGAWGEPVFLLLDDDNPAAAHYTPLFPATRKRLRRKQPDAHAALVDVNILAPEVLLRKRHAALERPADGAQLCRRRHAPAVHKKPAAKPPRRAPTTNVHNLAPLVAGLAARGLSQAAIQGILLIAKDTVRKLLHSAKSHLHGEFLDKALQHHHAQLEITFLEKFVRDTFATWSRVGRSFGILALPLAQPAQPPRGSADWVWMTLASWLLCVSCGLRVPQTHWTHAWLTKPFLTECDFCISLKKAPLLKNLVPRQDLWPLLLQALSPSDWQELVLVVFKVDYRTKRGGRSPVVSRQKLTVTRGVWRKDLPHPASPAVTRALEYLLCNNKHYAHYYSRLVSVLQTPDHPRTIPTAELFLRMPGIEVAARPWLYPQDLRGKRVPHITICCCALQASLRLVASVFSLCRSPALHVSSP